MVEYSNATLAKDLGQKKQVYAKVGIQEYWVVDLKHAQLKVFRELDNGDYQTELVLIQGTVSPLSFQDVVVDVRRLFS